MRINILLVTTFLLFPHLGCAEDAFVEGEVLVTFRPNFTEAQQDGTLRKQALKMDKRFQKLSGGGRGSIGWLQAKSYTTAQLIALMKANPEIATVEPNHIRRCSGIIPNDTNFSQLWGLKNTGQSVNATAGTSGVDTQFSAAWRLVNPALNTVVIGIIDSGLDINHPDIFSNLWTNPGEIAGDGIDNDSNGRIDDIHGFDFANNTARVTDSGLHGTHVSGTAAAVGRNASGVIGMDFRAKLIPMKASTDGINIPTSAVLAAYDYAVSLKQSGVNIVALNASFGGSSFNNAELSAITTLRDAGIILCAAAGNDASNNDTIPFYPANYDLSNIISVAALTQTNELASFSNYGATTVDLAAPGDNIISTAPLASSTFTTSVSVAATTYAAQQISMTGAVVIPGVSGTVIHCGIGNPSDFPVSVSGNIALIQRGTLTFASKVSNAMNAGAVAAIIYDNTADPLTSGSWQLDTTRNYIPALRVTQASGLAIIGQLPNSGTVVNGPSATLPYQFLDGTSMAAPHVTGAVAFAARNFPAENISQRISRILNHVTPVATLTGKMTTAGRLDLLKIVDTDNDGLPDWWETEHFGNLAQTATDNPDFDNFPNLDEFLTGTSPLNAASQLAFSSASPGAESGFDLAFPSVPDNSYKIERSDNLATWSTLISPVYGTGATIQITDPTTIAPGTKQFYRISLLPQ